MNRWSRRLALVSVVPLVLWVHLVSFVPVELSASGVLGVVGVIGAPGAIVASGGLVLTLVPWMPMLSLEQFMSTVHVLSLFGRARCSINLTELDQFRSSE